MYIAQVLEPLTQQQCMMPLGLLLFSCTTRATYGLSDLSGLPNLNESVIVSVLHPALSGHTILTCILTPKVEGGQSQGIHSNFNRHLDFNAHCGKATHNKHLEFVKMDLNTTEKKP